MKTNDLEAHLHIIGKNVHLLRQKRDEKCETVATNIGVSHSVISKIENGRYPAIKYELIVKIADYFDVSVDYMLSEANCS